MSEISLRVYKCYVRGPIDTGWHWVNFDHPPKSSTMYLLCSSVCPLCVCVCVRMCICIFGHQSFPKREITVRIATADFYIKTIGLELSAFLHIFLFFALVFIFDLALYPCIRRSYVCIDTCRARCGGKEVEKLG